MLFKLLNIYFSFLYNDNDWTYNFLFKIYPEAGTFVLPLFSSLLFQLALVAQWLVSRPFTATGPGTKPRLEGRMKEEILLPKLKQQSGQLGLKDFLLSIAWPGLVWSPSYPGVF